MEGRSISRRVMAEKPSMKRRRAEDDKNASHCQSWKKRMIKRAAEDDETWKKMDENMKIGFRKILKDLIEHSRGWAFSEPPEVKIPTDLAAVEKKLDRNIYSGAEEFVDEVRLALKKAKPYSPRWAAVLDANFMRQWKLLEARIKNVTNKKHHDFESCNGAKEQYISREQALRAAMLKTRFADTIHRAAQTLFPDKKSDLHRTMQQEEELKKRRRRERKALEEIEKRAEVDSTATTLKMWYGPTGYPTPEPLQRLGLHIINDQEEECCLDEYSFSYSVGFNEARLLSHRDL